MKGRDDELERAGEALGTVHRRQADAGLRLVRGFRRGAGVRRRLSYVGVSTAIGYAIGLVLLLTAAAVVLLACAALLRWLWGVAL